MRMLLICKTSEGASLVLSLRYKVAPPYVSCIRAGGGGGGYACGACDEHAASPHIRVWCVRTQACMPCGARPRACSTLLHVPAAVSFRLCWLSLFGRGLSRWLSRFSRWRRHGGWLGEGQVRVECSNGGFAPASITPSNTYLLSSTGGCSCLALRALRCTAVLPGLLHCVHPGLLCCIQGGEAQPTGPSGQGGGWPHGECLLSDWGGGGLQMAAACHRMSL